MDVADGGVVNVCNAVLEAPEVNDLPAQRQEDIAWTHDADLLALHGLLRKEWQRRRLYKRKACPAWRQKNPFVVLGTWSGHVRQKQVPCKLLFAVMSRMRRWSSPMSSSLLRPG